MARSARQFAAGTGAGGRSRVRSNVDSAARHLDRRRRLGGPTRRHRRGDQVSAARGEAIAGFLAEAGWRGIAPAPLATDASFRRYFRLADRGRRAVLMDAPPPQE